MKVLHVALAAALLATSAAAAEVPLGDEVVSSEDRRFITKGWTWLTGTVRTTFTASGPAEQVNRLDPQHDPLACEECELASSVYFEVGDEYQSISSR